MRGFISSFSPLLKAYKIEAGLLGLALLTSVASVGIFLSSGASPAQSDEISFNKSDTHDRAIYVDIAGAVAKPGLYKLPAGARLADLLRASGGLTSEADKEYFGRSFNLAHLLTDQEKMYIPTQETVASGQGASSTTGSSQAARGININEATAAELDTLPGVGPVTAGKIIDGRPYSAIDELVSRKILSQSVFDKIKDLISIN